jgi:predicted nucleic acid-binding OB-fold protein
MIYAVFAENEKGFCEPELATETLEEAVECLKKDRTNRFIEFCNDDETIGGDINLEQNSEVYYLGLEDKEERFESFEELKNYIINI